jgi:hypothetical protein
MRDAARASSAYAAGVGLLLLALLAASLWTASREWFSRDDFAFLAYVQHPDAFGWGRAFLPLEERFWPFYRPLSMETYFRICRGLFGLHAFGFFAVSLAFHFASGWLAYRVARRLGMHARVAAAAALLSVSRPGSLSEIYYASVFMYVGEVFFTLLAVTAFLAQLERGRAGLLLLVVLAVAAALLCNEHAVIAPAVLLVAAWGSGTAPSGAGARRLARALAPVLLLVALYLALRFGWIAPAPAGALYRPWPGPHVPANALRLLVHVAGGVTAAALALGLAGGLAAAALRGDAATRRWLARAGAACAAWTLLAVLPFALLPFAQGRWALPLALPLCLLFGVLLEAAWRAGGARWPRAFEALLLALLAAALPVAALRERAAAPLGAHPRALVEWIEAQAPPLSDRAVLVLLFGAPGLADAEQAEHFRYLAYGGGVLNAVYPGTQRVLRLHDLAQRAPRNAVRPDSVYLALRPDLSLERASAALLERSLERGFAPGPGSAE